MKLTVQILAFTLMLLTSFSAFSNDVCQEMKTNTTCQQDDYTALRALYLSANGDNWFNKSGWLTAAEFMANPTIPAGTDVGTWHGVTTNPGGCVTRLHLVYNNLEGSLPSEIGNLMYLTDLNLGGSLLFGGIPSEIGNLSNLTSLNLVDAAFGGATFPPEIGNLTQLTNLFLNHLTGDIPPEIGNLTNLTHLNLEFTQFSGGTSELGNLTELTNLVLAGITSIPPEVGQLTNLTYLSFTQSTGTIPPEFGNLTNLEELRLTDNQVTGSIPPELGNLTNLKQLLLSNNQLTGSIPSELGNLTDLAALFVGGNQLTGSIPSELGNLTNLKQLYLFHNQLTGGIPSELGNLINLKELGLNNNQLTGIIPVQLGNLTDVRKLYLSNNQLTGSIPSQLGNLDRMWSVHLSHNQLSGCYPTNLDNLCGVLGVGDDWPDYPNAYISDGNNLDATWRDFCDNNVGVCAASGCTSRVADANLVAISGEFSQFANDEFIKNFLSAESNYIKYRTEIHRILESKDARYTKVNKDFDKIKNIAQTLLFKSFVSKHPVNITTEHIKVMDDFLVSLNQVTNKGKLKDEITKVRGYLHVMKNKEIKDALIAFDRAEWTQIDTSNEFEAQLVNTNGQEPYVNYHLTNSGTVNINLYNANGQQIRLMQGNNSEGHHQIPIHKNELSAGIYFIHVEYRSNNGTQIKRVFKLPVIH